MHPAEAAPAAAESTPAIIAYRELAYEHVDRLVGYLTLLLGNAVDAEEVALGSFRRVWSAFSKGDIFDDAEEQLYRNATRAALQRIQRAKPAHGYQPPTTADDRAITAMGIVEEFEPQQQAGIFLVAWARRGYRLAGLATGLGEGRVRDLVFGARQQYRIERGRIAGATATCQQLAPLLSARRDEELSAAEREQIEEHLPGCAVCQETEALFAEFDAMLRGLRLPAAAEGVLDRALAIPTAPATGRLRGLRRLARLASGPALLVLTLMVAVVVFRNCSPPAIKTGAGRTSDVAYALSDNSFVLLETGSGREIGRLPAGVISADGQHVYSTRQGCRGRSTASTIVSADAGTLKSTDLGCVDGQVVAVAVNEQAGRLYLVDSGGEPSRLVAVDLKTLAVQQTLAAPADLVGVFDPTRLVAAPDRSALFSTAPTTNERTPTAALLRVDLSSLEVSGRTTFPSDDVAFVDLLPVSGTRVLAYDEGSGRVRDIDAAKGQLLSAMDLPPDETTADAGSPAPRHHIIAMSGDGAFVYVAPPTGGITEFDMVQGQIRRQLTPSVRYTAIALSTDGTLLYGLEADGSYVAIEVDTGKQVLSHANVSATTLVRIVPGL